MISSDTVSFGSMFCDFYGLFDWMTMSFCCFPFFVDGVATAL